MRYHDIVKSLFFFFFFEASSFTEDPHGSWSPLTMRGPPLAGKKPDTPESLAAMESELKIILKSDELIEYCEF